MQSHIHLERRQHERPPVDSVRRNAALHNSIEKLGRLATILADTAETLDALVGPSVESAAEQVDFYSSVRNFEIWLIQRALRRSGGSQLKAAALLNLRPTTLNTKIKTYEISEQTSAFPLE